MNDESLQGAYARLLATRTPASREGCVTPEALLALVERSGPEATRLETLNHAMSCAPCARDLELLRAVQGVRPSLTRRLTPLVAAASLLLVAGLYARSATRREPSAESFRGSEDVVLVAPRDTVDASADSVTFAWHRATGATVYELTVLDLAGARVVARTTEDTSLRVPSSTLVRGAQYVWSVAATTADNGRRSSTPATIVVR